MNKLLIIAASLAATASPALLWAEDARQIVIDAQNGGKSISEHYDGSLQVFNSKQKISTKTWTYNRLGVPGNSRAILRFSSPAEVKNVALLVIAHFGRPTELWMWIPAEEHDRKIVLQKRSARFFATDFSFEDLEDLDVTQWDYKLLGEESVGETACWKIESRPRASQSSQYTSSLLWVRKAPRVLVRVDNFNKEKLIRRIVYSDIQQVDGVWTALTIEALDTIRNTRTVLHLDKVEYNIPMKDEDFTREALPR